VKKELRQKTTTALASDSLTSHATASSSNEDLMNTPPSRASKGGTVIKHFLNKCGFTSNNTMMSSVRMLTIEQEIAKLSSIPKDNHEVKSFWQAHGQEMPKLTMIARKYLCICATSVPSESAFSVSNYVLRKNRLALASKNVKHTMFLKDKL
jgi:hypothetical protein